MCGIAGIVTLNGAPVDTARIAAMIKAQRHRGPDDSDLFVDGPVGLGSNRLSILDVSAAGRMPMLDPDTGNRIVHNGEIYNYKELVDELGLGPRRTGTDTEVALKAYAKLGPDCVERFNGIFGFAIWDVRARTLFCARDRLGVKPLFYARQGEEVIFASEIKALFAAGVPRRPDLGTIRDYLCEGIYEHGTRTFFDGVTQVPPGWTLRIAGGEVSLAPYWTLAAPVPDPAAVLAADDAAAATAAEEFGALAEDAIRLQLRSDVPVAVHSSGGLDSSLMMALINRVNGGQGKIRAFSHIYGEPQYDETAHVEKLVSALGWSVDYCRVAPDDIPDLARSAMHQQEQPFPGIVTLAKTKLIRDSQDAGAKVILEGQGGDEIGAGYQYHFGSHVLDLVEAGRPDLATTETAAFARCNGLSSEAGAGKVFAGMSAYFRPGRSADGTSFVRDDLISADLRTEVGQETPLDFACGSHLRNMQYRDLMHTKLPRILRSCDRASMAYSRELRVPFLDHRLVEFAFRLPGTVKIRDGVQRRFFRDVVEGAVGADIAAPPKRPVVDPQRDWLIGPLRDWVADLIHSDTFAARGLFDAARVRDSFTASCASGRLENSFHIWQWVSMELWFREFLDTAETMQRAS